MNKILSACLRSLVPLSALALALLGTALPADAQQTYYIYADHLDTPRLIENQSQQMVWRWDNDDPFGGNIANANPSGLGAFEFNLRFPGQYFDRETNQHYNYFRDYSPEIGRYIESDPIGLEGGTNTYTYVNANPIAANDPQGLVGGTAAGAAVGAIAGPPGVAIGALVGTVVQIAVGVAAVATVASISGSTTSAANDPSYECLPGTPCKNIREIILKRFRPGDSEYDPARPGLASYRCDYRCPNGAEFPKYFILREGYGGCPDPLPYSP